MNPLATLLEFFRPQRDRLWRTRMALILCAAALTSIGIAFVHSATATPELDASFPSSMAHTQLVKALVGVAALAATVLIDYRRIERWAYIFYGTVVLILASLLVAKRASGEQLVRWVQIGFLNIQPSELMKLALVVALGRYLKFRSDLRSVVGLVVPLALTMLPFVLVVAQPNLGTALMLPPMRIASRPSSAGATPPTPHPIVLPTSGGRASRRRSSCIHTWARTAPGPCRSRPGGACSAVSWKETTSQRPVRSCRALRRPSRPSVLAISTTKRASL